MKYTKDEMVLLRGFLIRLVKKYDAKLNWWYIYCINAKMYSSCIYHEDEFTKLAPNDKLELL